MRSRYSLVVAFLLGVIAFAFFHSVLSYQSLHCSQTEQSNGQNTPSQNNLDSLVEKNGDNRNTKIEKHQKRIHAVCGVIGFVPSAAALMNDNEGAFLGLFTFLLVFATIWLVLATNRLWKGADDTAKRQLRAYIGMANDGTTFEPEVNPGNGMIERRGPVKIFSLNYGSTPARDATMYVHITELPPPKIIDDTLCTKKAGPQIVHPGQLFGKIVGDKTPSDAFFLYGFVDYIDAFNSKWRFRFAFTHDPKRILSPSKDDRWIAHTEHNDEQ